MIWEQTDKSSMEHIPPKQGCKGQGHQARRGSWKGSSCNKGDEEKQNKVNEQESLLGTEDNCKFEQRMPSSI